MQIPMPSTKVTKNSRCKGFFFSVSEVLRSWRGGLQSSPTTHLWQGWFLEVPKIYLTRGQVKIDNFVGCCWVEHFFWGSKLKLLKGAEEQQNRGGVFFLPSSSERKTTVIQYFWKVVASNSQMAMFFIVWFFENKKRWHQLRIQPSTARTSSAESGLRMRIISTSQGKVVVEPCM